jgi:hypothetical protein
MVWNKKEKRVVERCCELIQSQSSLPNLPTVRSSRHSARGETKHTHNKKDPAPLGEKKTKENKN